MATEIVNTHEAKSRLSELIRAAEEGTEVIVARNGRPVARIIAWEASRARREPGSWRGKLRYSNDDIVESDPDVLAIFDESADVG